MWPYWLMFLVPMVLALQEAARLGRHPSQLPGAKITIPTVWWVIFVFYVFIIGWRHEVGGDWGNYLRNYNEAINNRHFLDWWWNDPGYRLLEWLAVEYDWGIYGVNLMAAGIFFYGLVVFCRHLPRPWLALTVAVPYLVIILGMGYSRQGIALGCIMAGIVALGQSNVRKFVIWAIMGAMFHKSAVILLPMAALASSKNRWLTAVWVAVVVVISYILLLEESIEQFQYGYLDAEYQSEGAFIRLVMNLLPALLLLVKQNRFATTIPQQRLWFWFSIGAVFLFVMYYLSPSSTAVDRVGLYLLPIQVMVFSYLPEVLGRKSGRSNLYWILGVIGYYAAVQFVWLNYANNARYWIPYRWYPFELIF